MGIPLPPGCEPKAEEPKKYKGLTSDELSFILRATLTREHSDDPNVVGFIASYLRCRSAAQAAREMGLKPSAGHNLLQRPDIWEAVRAISEKSALQYGYDGAEVVERVKEIAGVDPVVLEREDGSYVKSLREIPAEARRAIKKFKVKNLYETDPNGMKVVTGELIEVEFWDKMRANELLGREKDLFVEKKKVEHGISAGMRDILLESRDRAQQFALGQDKRAELPAPIDVTPVKVEDGSATD